MGFVYILDIRDWSLNNSGNHRVEITETFSDSQATEILALNEVALSEIAETISPLSHRGLTNLRENRAPNLVFAYAEDKGSIVGYGLGYLDNEQREVYYIDHIVISPGFRRRGVGYGVLVALLKNVQSNLPKVRYVKSITQAENVHAAMLLNKIGFKKPQTLFL